MKEQDNTMPSPKKATLDLEAWASFRPQERSNDFEYNMLLHKFKSLFNEVKDYHELHSNCSVTRAAFDSENDSPNYSNYVNLDFFLKQSNSQLYDGLYDVAATTNEDDDDVDEDNDEDEGEVEDEDDSSDDSDDDEGDTTQMSQSLSSDQNCDDVLRDLSPRKLVEKLSITNNSSQQLASPTNSVTLASSGELLDEQRSSTHSNNHTHPSPSSIKHDNTRKLASFFSMNNSSNNNLHYLYQESPINQKFPASPKDVCKSSPSHHTLGPIHEHSASSYVLTKQSMSLDQSIDQVNNDSSLTSLETNNNLRSFLSVLNLSSTSDVFEDKAQRRIVKESFAVEFCGRRKLRHLFLFNDVVVCAKYQASSKQKFTFDVKWYLNLNGISISDLKDVNEQVKYDKEAIENQILAIRTNLMLLRGQLQHVKRGKHKQPSKIIKKLKKKRTELEAELVLLLPHLPLVIKHTSGKKYIFFLSSNFDRNQWIDSIKFLQSQLIASKSLNGSPTSKELQAWIQTCRKNLNPSLGTFLLRSNCDDDLLYGDLQVKLDGLSGNLKPGSYYFCFEVDSYGHFSQKASSAVFRIDNAGHNLNEEYVFPLDGAHTLRILLYQDLGLRLKPSVIGKAHIELSRGWFLDKPVEKIVEFNPHFSLKTQLSYSSSELLSMRIPHTKLCPTFGMDINNVCKREKTEIPLLIQLCVNEVERRGMREVGIYRMSGTSTDIQRLKKAFETNPYVAELLLRDIDINSVTGFLKTYLREMPEGLFTNKLYPTFVAAFNIPQSESIERTKKMLELFHLIPTTNQHTIIYLVTHLVKVNRYESCNKMSLTNLATVLGPNILKPPTGSSVGANSFDPFTAVVVSSMSQAGILYFFLNRKFSNLPLTELDSSELSRSS